VRGILVLVLKLPSGHSFPATDADGIAFEIYIDPVFAGTASHNIGIIADGK
jgi:hypothetical protein